MADVIEFLAIGDAMFFDLKNRNLVNQIAD